MSFGNIFRIENSNSNNRGATGKELVLERHRVTLSSNAVDDVETKYKKGEIVFAIPCYKLTVDANGHLNFDFSAVPDGDIEVLVAGREYQLDNN